MIGIITFHRAKNYGAVLQAYALCKYLNDNDIKAEVIDYYSPFIMDFYNPYNKLNKRLLKNILLFPFIKKKYRNFDIFIKKNIKLSRKVDNFSQLEKLSVNYQYLLTGSDQVWNNHWTGFDKNYFLEFCPDYKKNSYAASFGFSKIPDDLKDEYYRLLSSFNRISVREAQGNKIIEDLLGYQVEIMPDPVCLIEKDVWKNLYRKKIGKPYLLLYTLENSVEIINFAKEIAKKENLDIRFICDTVIHKHDFIYESYISPERFVSLFFNAKYIITNSFHGTMFSIIFNKNFFIKLQTNKNAPNSRLIQLIDKYGLNDLVLGTDISYEKYMENLSKINWNRINNILNDEKQRASDYLLKL